MQIYQESLTELFRTFVKHVDSRNEVLKWIGDCLYENQGKNQDWSIYDSTTSLLFVSDAFSMNLSVILLHLVKPFSDVYSSKLLKINPIYVITDNEHVHLKGRLDSLIYHLFLLLLKNCIKKNRLSIEKMKNTLRKTMN